MYNFLWCRTLPVPTVCRGELSPNGRFILKNNPYLSNFHAAAHHKNNVLNNPLYKGRTLGSRNIHTLPSIVFAYSTEPVKCKDVPGTAAELSASGNPNPDSSFGCFLVPKCSLKFYIQWYGSAYRTVRCNTNPNHGSASASMRNQIQMRIRWLVSKKWEKITRYRRVLFVFSFSFHCNYFG